MIFMFITATYTYGFKIPEEKEMYERFWDTNSKRDYLITESTNYIYCSRTLYQTTVDAKGAEKWIR